MTTRATVARKIKKLQRVMDMQDWSFVLDGSAPSDTNRLAEVSVVTGSRVARIAVSKDLLKMNDDALTYILVHELLHAYMWELSEHHGALTALLRKDARAIADEAWNRVEERTVDALALVIVSLIKPGSCTRMRAVTQVASIGSQE